ncbi:hypothetical protein GOB94_08905 [Granulicella sp. 5B5]|uniref:hypothetical protein n=1 Tax=Granulicella sp. 5B5 TaxID=1617967 RepID=UPI0015F376D1|nr:hypothetical protein [Granulicella sp. 5B5]QMV18787.1 hypothetical protein GOB94_08905 [Granulicella sp. 5B5]
MQIESASLSFKNPSHWRRTRWLLLVILAILPRLAHAQGGPPFLTDDPETPGNQHWEINYGFIGDRNPGQGAYQVPDFDLNYGLGDRIQLKYELPIAIAETRTSTPTPATIAPPNSIATGLGESLLGVKWRFYEHHPHDPYLHNRFGTGLSKVFGHPSEERAPAGGEEPRVDFSLGTYPQLSLNNPTHSVARGVVDPGPNFFLPIEVNSRLGPLRMDAEVGYNFGNRNLQQGWSRGLLVGHEFSDSTEAYLELHDDQDATRLDGQPKQRETTLGLGGRQTLNRRKTLVLLLMGGRSFQTITTQNSQPSWVAYVGLQMLLGPHDHQP